MVYGNFYGNFPVKGLFLRVFTAFSCKITVNHKNEVKIYIKKNYGFPLKKKKKKS